MFDIVLLKRLWDRGVGWGFLLIEILGKESKGLGNRAKEAICVREDLGKDAYWRLTYPSPP